MTFANAAIDISHHNNIGNFGKVREAGIRAVFHKATQGTTGADPTFPTHRQGITGADMLLGAYHFGTAGSASAQADHFLDVVGDVPALLVLDLEPNPQGHDMSLLEAEEFVHHIATRTGRYPGLYSGHTIKEMLAQARITSPDQTELSKCWLWIAQYGPAPLIPKVWNRWEFWQYTDGGVGPQPHEVPGVGRCDRDQYNGDEQKMIAFWKSNQVAASD